VRACVMDLYEHYDIKFNVSPVREGDVLRPLIC
jgi:hypothetical protein